MTPTDIARVQTYLRRLLGSDTIRLIPPAKPGLSVEFAAGHEVIGTVHRDDEEGEVSYSIQIIVLDEDLPAAAMPSRSVRR